MTTLDHGLGQTDPRDTGSLSFIAAEFAFPRVLPCVGQYGDFRTVTQRQKSVPTHDGVGRLRHEGCLESAGWIPRAVGTRRRGTVCSGRTVIAWHGLDGLGRVAWLRQMESSLQAWFTGARLGRKEVVARSGSVEGFLVGVAGYGAAVWCVGRHGGCQGSSRRGRVAGWRVGRHGSDGGGRVLLSRGCWLVGRHRRDGVG
ncbi:hypothetical protein Bbelb_150750 [Branchiostoma belcheri]|nr:hypothetical protein Bbelb_150750 [Branchiostoma belcheri]